MTSWLARVLRRLGVEDLRLQGDDLRRVVILLLACVFCSAVVVDYARAPTEELRPGDVAPHTVKAPFRFQYTDHADYERRRKEAADAVLPVFVHRVGLADELANRITVAFEAGRERLAQALQPDPPPEGEEPPEQAEGALTPEERTLVAEAFTAALDVHLPGEVVSAFIDQAFPAEAERLSRDLLRQAMHNLIIRDRDTLPQERRELRIIALDEGGERTESLLTDFEQILTPERARQQITWGVMQAQAGSSRVLVDASATIARALVRSNLSFDPLQTEERRQQAMASVNLELETVKRGAILFRAGDTLTQRQIQVYNALQDYHSEQDLAKELVAVGLFLLLLFVSLYQFGSSYLEGFSTRVRDVGAAAGLLALTALLARLIVASSESLAALIGFDAEATSIWFCVPVAGAAMLVRLLLGVSWTVVFSFAAATVCGLVMGLQALPMVFFLISGIAAAGAVEHTRERIAVLRAGFYVGVVNAACVLLIHFVQLFVAESELSMATTMRPFWSMSFALLGGLLSSFLVLGLVPLFESIGFVTDYRLMELANLNHPLLRQLMLRAPGSYHHSVIVGTLAEAGCEAIGANALLAKVASYFHDVGKSLKPQYFVENQRDNINKHAGLDPYQSARIIISHVIDGGRMAREYNLPQPILDNIYMHHGTGILQYFYAQAVAEAEEGATVDEMAFRYPGPKPNTREAGVVMLADKVEAATRTIQAPDEENIRAMISRIVSSVIADGQFSECPLTLQEIQTVADTFVKVLLGIYHQRIEYPQTADVSRASNPPHVVRPPEAPRHAIITLDLQRPRRVALGAEGNGAPSEPVLPAAEVQNPVSGRVLGSVDAKAGPTASGATGFDHPRSPSLPPEDHPPLRAEGPRPEGTLVRIDPSPARRESVRPDPETLAADEERSDVVDYESIEHLPRGE